ncbi:MAG TPA: hypothetical protein VJ908_12310 [Wenzhouxiangellaceae bacterium]|nr:hypothetical protein [Wenzhouxiangellaceae bacterium]
MSRLNRRFRLSLHRSNRGASGGPAINSQRQPYPQYLRVIRVHLEVKSKPAREALHACVLDHHIPVHRAHPLFSGPFGNALQKIGAKTESTDFPPDYDCKLGIPPAGVHDGPNNRADPGDFRWQSLDQHQCERVVLIQAGQRLCVLRGQLGDRMQESKTDLLGCQITKASAQCFGILGLDRSCDQFAAVGKA